MLQLKRQQDILSLLGEHKSMTVKELCAVLYASPATIRRDLAEMERAGLLRRSFGGAVLTESYPDQMPLAVRASDRITEKSASVPRRRNMSSRARPSLLMPPQRLIF